jgi:hypothetical protein
MMRKQQRDAGAGRRQHLLTILSAAETYRCTKKVKTSYRFLQLSLSIKVTTGTEPD